MFDVFYIGKKPELFPHEQPVDSIDHALGQSKTRFFWIVNYLADYSNFDFLWEPSPWQAHQRHAWPSQHQKDSGTYLVPAAGYKETNYRQDTVIVRLPTDQNWRTPYEVSDFDYSWHPDPSDPPMTYYFGTQWQRTGGPIYYNGGPNIKIVSLPRATVLPSDQHWNVPSIVSNNFDRSWHPDLLDLPYVYQFATQHQKTGGPVYTVPGATEVKYMSELKIQTVGKATAVIEIDHLDGNAGHIPNTTKTVRYFDNYRDTLVRIAKSLVTEHEYVWICSSICHYEDFDFSWHPEQWQATMLHVFPSNEQKFGDTFFMHVPTFAEYGDKKALLEWYDVNYVNKLVPRRRLPVIEHTGDSQADAVKNTDWQGPLALFTTVGLPMTIPTVPLWRTEVKTVMPLSAGASAVIVPKIAKGDVKTQLYDYPYIDKTHRNRHYDQPLDIVFIDNGESNAEDHWMLLENRILGLEPNRLHRVSNVNGRVAAYHAAARASTTPWFFAVFAKLAIDVYFEWNWQPDRLQQPKHYIFHAINPVNGLQYGHQAMIAYNRKLVLENQGLGLDFTLDSAHEVVPINSGTAQYNATPWMAWRTAFREVIKLCSSSDVESQYRLKQWLATPRTNVENWAWSVWGAEDAVEYYQAVKGEPTELRKSYEWDWLASYAFLKRGLAPDQ